MESRLNMILALRTKVPEKLPHSMASLDMRLRNGELINIEINLACIKWLASQDNLKLKKILRKLIAMRTKK